MLVALSKFLPSHPYNLIMQLFFFFFLLDIQNMAATSTNLPEEIWESIFSLFDHYQDLEALSSVCKRFLSITNQLKLSLAITYPTTVFLPRILKRFKNLKIIDAREFEGDLEGLVEQISQSGLHLEELNLSNQNHLPIKSLCQLGYNMISLKILKCSKLIQLQDRDLVAIASSLPMLEELDISYPENGHDSMDEWGCMTKSRGNLTDAGVEELSSKLRLLMKINVSGNHFISDRSLIVLSSNCVLLREIIATDCCFITQKGIGFVMRNSTNLVSVSVNGMEIFSPPSPLPHPSLSIMDSISYAKALSALEFSYTSISDEFLCSVAKESFPLKKISLSNCYNFTFPGIFSLLHAYQSLTFLTLERVDFLTDKSISELSKFLHNLVYINLNFCSKLSNSTFFILTTNCPSLNHIQMERTYLGEGDLPTNFAINSQIETLSLGRNSHLNDEGIKIYVSICPNLQVLDLSCCIGITEKGIAGLLKTCKGLRHLTLNQCGQMMNLGIGWDLCKLEVLELRGSAIDDGSLAVIARKCPALLHLDLTGCLSVTDAGVKEVVRNCTGLRKIILSRCDNMNVGILAWMVFSRPSLRKIILPCGFITTENQMNLFLRHGCHICKSKV